jgi:hypothetical protein
MYTSPDLAVYLADSISLGILFSKYLIADNLVLGVLSIAFQISPKNSLVPTISSVLARIDSTLFRIAAF